MKRTVTSLVFLMLTTALAVATEDRPPASKIYEMQERIRDLEQSSQAQLILLGCNPGVGDLPGEALIYWRNVSSSAAVGAVLQIREGGLFTQPTGKPVVPEWGYYKVVRVYDDCRVQIDTQ